MMDVRSDLTWTLDELATVPHVLYAVVVSTDGLLIQRSTALPQAEAEVFAAAVASLYSVAMGVSRRFGSGALQQIITEYQDQTLFVAAAGTNGRLAVLCDQAVDMGTIAYEMSRLVARIGRYLGSETRVGTPTLSGP